MVDGLEDKAVHPLTECYNRFFEMSDELEDPKYRGRFVTIIKEGGKYVIKDFGSFGEGVTFLDSLPEEQQRGAPSPVYNRGEGEKVIF